MTIFLLIVVLTITVDLVTKYLAAHFLAPDGTAGLIPWVISLQYAENHGAAFSWFWGARLWLVLISSVFIAIALTYYIWQKRRTHLLGRKRSKIFDIGFGFFIGGALGNLFDRTWYGFVRDFFRLDFMNFPIFNFADVFINIGVILILVYLVFIEDRERKRGEHAPEV